ncbi:hypothetical protein FISHEDRAFT_28570, partial [Fistulina hepatica ATCC 64428]
VLSVKGRIGDINMPEKDLPLDSGANITLISHDYFVELQAQKKSPNLKKGKKLNLYQLTDKAQSMEGYCNLPIFMEADDSQKIRMDTEAYIVKGMSIPILLGEDFMLNYAIGVTRNAVEGSRIHIDNGRFQVSAIPIERPMKIRIARHKTRNENDKFTIRSDESCTIKPGSSARIRLNLSSSVTRERDDWVLERNLIPIEDGHSLAIPNALIQSQDPFVHIANPGTIPISISKGDIIGQIFNPEEYFQKPRSEENRQSMEQIARFV